MVMIAKSTSTPNVFKILDQHGQTVATVDFGPHVDFGLQLELAAAYAAALDLLEACRAAETWLEGWASAEPYLSIIKAAIAKTACK